MSVQQRIKLLIVDPHTIVRAGLVAVLQDAPDISIVGDAADAEEALAECYRQRPDVIVTEILLAQMDGITFLNILHHEYPEVKVIVLSRTVDDHLVQRAIQAGVVSYLLKNITVNTLIKAVRWACCGQSHLSPEATQALIHLTRVPQQVGHDLTHRETEVLALMCDGLSNREISQTLDISNSTVQFHVSSILSKLGVTNRVEAVSMAFRHHLVS